MTPLAWILLIIVSGTGVHHLEFPTENACNSARAMITDTLRNQQSRGATVFVVMCVPLISERA